MKEKEIKLKEFNFKVFHGILPCIYNLAKWKIRSQPQCDVCNESHTIMHLLYDCHYAKCMWAIVNATFGLNITYEQVLGLDLLFDKNDIATLVCFLIYKEWLVLSLEHKKRTPPFCRNRFEYELNTRLMIYKQCHSIRPSHVDDIRSLLSHMEYTC